MHTRSEGIPQLLDVNCTVLDALVVEYLASAELIEDVSSESTDHQLTSRLAAFAAYEQLHQGNVCNAMAIVTKFCPQVLQDQRLGFKLKRQQFIELLRQSTTAGDAAALACARDELAPLALDAYPEAYLDFKRAMLMLVQPQQQEQSQSEQGQQQQQQDDDGSLQARRQLAEVLQHTMLQEKGCRSPQLAQLLAYLCLVFSQYTSGSHSSSSSRGSGSHAQLQQQLLAAGGELVSGLLLEGRDEGPLPPDVAGMPATERDVQALMAAVSIPRAAALNALKAAGGDAAAALAGQLMRFRLNIKKIDVLAWEYAVARGLVEPEDAPAAAAPAPAVANAPATAGAAPSDIMDIDQAPAATAGVTDGPASAATAAAGRSSGAGMDRSSSGGSSKAQKRSNNGSACVASATAAGSCGSPFTAVNIGCSQGPGLAAAAGGPVAAAMLRSESQSPPYKVPRWRCKQTPSRFLGRDLRSAGGAAAAAAADGELQQEMRLLQVIVDGAGSQLGAASGSSSHQVSKQTTQQQAQQQAQQQQQQQQQQLLSCEPGSKASAELLAEQLVHATRAAQQQQRWQQLQHSLKAAAAAGSSSTSGGTSAQQQQHRDVLALLAQLQELVNKGSWPEVEGLVDELQPGLLQESPSLSFELKRCQYMQLVQSNDLPAALQLARSKLTPLADAHPELLPHLKSSMALLLPGPGWGATAGNSSSSSSLEEAGSRVLSQLLPLLQAKLGVEQPALVKLLRVLLTGHKGWFRVQRCHDPFAAALGLDQLLQADPAVGFADGSVAAAAGGASGVPANAAAAVGGLGTLSGVVAAAGAGAAGDDDADFGSPPGLVDADMTGSEDAEQLEFDEAEVLQVMEVLELPRATALELLAEQGGDAQAVIMQAFGA